MPDIFVSYSRDDQPTARLYAESFEREGFTVWWDQSLTPGEAFDQVTEKALDEAGAVVVLWSKTSVNSRWVRAEATQANTSGRLMPVMIEACRRPIMFELTHTAELSHWEGDSDDPAWQAFLAGVRRVVQRNASGSAAAAGAGTPIASPPAAASVAASPAPATAPAGREARPAAPKPAPKVAPRPQPAPAEPQGVPRRNVLLYGASAAGLVAAGFAGGVLLKGGREAAPAAPPTFQRITFRRGLIRGARFAPDGQTILYGALWDGDLCRVYSTRTDNPESRALDLPNANVLAVSHSGDLALSMGPNLDGVFTYGTLARAPIAGGAPRELVENVKFADWSPDGAELAIIRNVDGADRLEYPIGNVLFQPRGEEGTGLGFVRVAADGRRLAFVHYPNPGSLVGRVCVFEDGRITVLTEESVNLHGLVWRGEELVYTSSEDRPLFRAVFALRPGSAPRVVARLPVNVTVWDAAADGRLLIAQTDDRAVMIARQGNDDSDRDLSWLDASTVADVTPDGRLVLFREQGQGVRSMPAAYLRGIDGSPAVHLGLGQALALSPDARWTLISGFRETFDTDVSQQVFAVPTGAGDPKPLRGEGLSFGGARWLPDGRSVVINAFRTGETGWRLHTMEIPDGEPRPFTPEGIRGWALSPDGSTVAAAGRQPGITLYPVAGGEPRTVPNSGDAQVLVGWIREGLLEMRFGDVSAPRGEVYLIDPATGRRRSWSNILPRDSAGVMIFHSLRTTPDGTTRVFSWHRALSNLYIATGLS